MFVFVFAKSDVSAKLTVLHKPTDSVSVFLECLCILIQCYIFINTHVISFNKWILYVHNRNCNNCINSYWTTINKILARLYYLWRIAFYLLKIYCTTSCYGHNTVTMMFPYFTWKDPNAVYAVDFWGRRKFEWIRTVHVA